MTTLVQNALHGHNQVLMLVYGSGHSQAVHSGEIVRAASQNFTINLVVAGHQGMPPTTTKVTTVTGGRAPLGAPNVGTQMLGPGLTLVRVGSTTPTPCSRISCPDRTRGYLGDGGKCMCSGKVVAPIGWNCMFGSALGAPVVPTPQGGTLQVGDCTVAVPIPGEIGGSTGEYPILASCLSGACGGPQPAPSPAGPSSPFGAPLGPLGPGGTQVLPSAQACAGGNPVACAAYCTATAPAGCGTVTNVGPYVVCGFETDHQISCATDPDGMVPVGQWQSNPGPYVPDNYNPLAVDAIY